MAESSLEVEVLRPDGRTTTEAEDELVPGDVVLIPPQGCTMTCDAVLINGTCIVNESMLTGESVPVTKVPLPTNQTSGDQQRVYSPETDKRHTLFCGTKVIQIRQSGKGMLKATAVVVQTGFCTMKGALIRSILYPRPMEFKLHRDAMMFVAFYIAFAFVGVIYSIWITVQTGTSVKNIILLTLDSVTVAVQPLLPVALTTGMLYSQIRLKKKGIFCISPQRINLAGVLDVVCFDKTGTLTEDGLDLLGFRRVEDNQFVSMKSDTASLPPCPFLHTMTTCHSVALINGELKGDPLDLKMFEATGWTLDDHSHDNEDGQPICVKPPASTVQTKPISPFSILKQFTFSSSLQRMSVIAQNQDSSEIAGFAKGSPEIIVVLSKPETVPDDFNAVLEEYTSEGFRVLALAWKPLEENINNQTFTRDAVEQDLSFLGFLVWQNRLKPASQPVITELHKSNVRTVMVTGDNILTAINVAGKCSIVSPEDTITQVTALSTETKERKLQYKKLTRKHVNINYCGDLNVDDNQVSRNISETEHFVLDGLTFTYIQQHCPQALAKVLIDKSGTECFALDGHTFAHIQQNCPQVLPEILLHGAVFARMSPNQKQELVEALQELEYTVGMCGDGANDCGALKTANAGISLSEAEASVASPFTSNIPNITCVPMIIKEGRCALVTSFGLFKYIALYTFIMYVAISITKKYGSYPGSMMFTTWDIVIATTIVLLMGLSGPQDEIALQKPPTRLVRAPNLASLVIHILVLTATQVAAIFILQSQKWHSTFVPDPDNPRKVSMETTVVYLIANFQFLLYGILFTPGRPHRQPIKNNRLYVLDLLFLTALCLFLLFVPIKAFLSFMSMELIPHVEFRLILLALCFGNVFVSFVIEYFIIPRDVVQKVIRCWTKVKAPKFQQLLVTESPFKPHTSENAV